MASAISHVDPRSRRRHAAALVGVLLGTGCATAGVGAQRELGSIRDELAAQRKSNEDQRHDLDELRIRIEQLEAKNASKSPSKVEASVDVPDLPVVRVRPPAALDAAGRAPPVDTRLAIKDDGPIDLNAIIARNSPGESAFATAISFYNAGDWENASGGFRRFVGRFPSNELVPQAIYLHGMSEVALQHWNEGVALFDDVIRAHAKSDYLAGSLIGLARCQVKLGHAEKARPLLQRVLGEFPGSVEAAQANAILDEMGASGRS